MADTDNTTQPPPQEPTSALPKAEDFLNPSSMLTPGLAGGSVLAITLMLSGMFGLNQLWCLLGFSFLFGLLVLVKSVKWWLGAVYYVINSLIICSVAYGALQSSTVDRRDPPATSGPPAGVTIQSTVVAAPGN